jgi:poly(3-hydroxybutyrate) depolymerase
MGNAEQAVRFTASGSYSSALTGQKNGALYLIQQGKAGNLQVVANGFDSLNIYLPSLDTVLALTLKKSTAGSSPSSSPSSSSSGASSPSSSAITSSSSSAASLNPSEQTYAFGYALKNAPRPSKGCGSASKLQKTKSVENGDRFEMNVNGESREFFITLPKNYDNNKPYKLLFAMHCMGSNAEDFVHHAPDYDHPTPYYGQQELDKEGNYIFVAPRGDTDGMPWSMSSDKDHKFIDQLITLLEENYCIDTTRIFSTGFSFGAMFTNSLAWDMQHRLRAVAVYAAVDQVIWLPKNAGKPIAWMGVHGKRDGTCQYSRAISSTLPAILKNNGKADANGNFTDASSEKPEEFSGTAGHLCYDFKTVDERFPVKFCSWNGQHQWTAHDGGNTDVGQGWQNTWVPEEVHKFLEQF